MAVGAANQAARAAARDADVVVALEFYPKGYTPEPIVFAAHAADSYDTIDIPAGDDNGRVDGYYFLKEPAQVVSFQPHLHNRGKRQCVEAIYPSGLVETLSCAKHDYTGPGSRCERSTNR